MSLGKNRSRGFTIIELVLSMTFISVLLLAIALTVIQISNGYNRGITLKDVNQAGRELAAEIQRGVSASAPFPIDPGPGTRFVDEPWGGRLCLGQYSYIWNYGSTLNNPNPLDKNDYLSNPDNLPDIRFVKVTDSSSSYCEDPDKDVDPTAVTELLSSSDHDLAIQRFVIVSEPTAIDTRTGERLYSFNLLLGTNGESSVVADYSGCKEPGQPGADLAYCSIQEFNLSVRAGNLIE